MPFGPRPRSVLAIVLRAALAGAALAASVTALGGCATGGAGIESRDVERRAVLDRWTRCVERQSGVAALSEVRARLESDCEGHRRDVLNAFPPHMEARLERLMDERAAVALQTRLRDEGPARDAHDPLLRHVIDAFSDG